MIPAYIKFKMVFENMLGKEKLWNCLRIIARTIQLH